MDLEITEKRNKNGITYIDLIAIPTKYYDNYHISICYYIHFYDTVVYILISCANYSSYFSTICFYIPIYYYIRNIANKKDTKYMGALFGRYSAKGTNYIYDKNKINNVIVADNYKLGIEELQKENTYRKILNFGDKDRKSVV